MFKGISNFAKSGNGKWILVIVVVLFIIWALMSYSNSKRMVMDNMSNQDSSMASSQSDLAKPSVQGAPVNMQPPNSQSGDYALKPVSNPSDLLPKDKHSKWADLNPVNNGNPQLPDLLQAGNLQGLDTIGQTLKNPNLQLRSDPIIVKQAVGPWNNSTYEPDLARVPLELGCGQP